MTLAEALRPALDKLQGAANTRNAKEMCLIAMIELFVVGDGYDNAAFWKREDTPARSTYMKWRKQGNFVPVLEECREIAIRWRTQQTAVSVEEALVLLQLKAPDAAKKLIKLVENASDGTALKAANSILDRASKDTGKKAQISVPGIEMALDKVYGDDDDDEEE